MSTISNLPHPHRLSRFTVSGGSAVSGVSKAVSAGPADLTERVDDLDALIWTAARTTDDPQLAVVRAREHAESVFIGLVLTIGAGAHRLNCSVPTASGPVTAGEGSHGWTSPPRSRRSACPRPAPSANCASCSRWRM